MALTITYSITPVVTANYTASWGELVRVDPSGGSLTITLTTAAGNAGRHCRIKNVTTSTNTIVVDGAGSENVDLAATYIMNLSLQAITPISDGTKVVVA